MSQDSWQDIKSKIESLGLKLKLHLDQEQEATEETEETEQTGEESQPRDTTSTGATGDTRAAIEDLGHKLQEAFASFGTASKDPAVRSDVKEIGTMLKDAMADTFSNVSSEVSDAFKRSDRGTGGPADGDEAGTDSTDDGEGPGSTA